MHLRRFVPRWIALTIVVASLYAHASASPGDLDLSFGGGTGKVTTDFGTGIDECRGVEVQSDGKIVAAGYAFNGNNADFAVVRYNSNGSLDTSFGENGKVITAIGNNNDFGICMAIQSDGKIFLQFEQR